MIAALAASLPACLAAVAFEDALSISNLTYSEPGSPFPDCREGLTDRLSNSVLLPGIEPRTGRKRDAAITTELLPTVNQPCLTSGSGASVSLLFVFRRAMFLGQLGHF